MPGSSSVQRQIDGERYSLDAEVGRVIPDDPASRDITHNDIRLTKTPTPQSPLRRRPQRAGTFRTVQDFEGFQYRPGWRPGAEPGVDPTKPDGGHASMPSLSAPCDITVVEFSHDDLAIQHLDNDTLVQFLKLPQPKWSMCRWISVNGLSWDVIKALGEHSHLHKLAIEDIMNTRNRTKAEWQVHPPKLRCLAGVVF